MSRRKSRRPTPWRRHRHDRQWRIATTARAPIPVARSSELPTADTLERLTGACDEAMNLVAARVEAQIAHIEEATRRLEAQPPWRVPSIDRRVASCVQLASAQAAASGASLDAAIAAMRTRRIPATRRDDALAQIECCVRDARAELCNTRASVAEHEAELARAHARVTSSGEAAVLEAEQEIARIAELEQVVAELEVVLDRLEQARASLGDGCGG